MKYVQSILTAHVVKPPPDHEGALSVLIKLRGQKPSIVRIVIDEILQKAIRRS